MPYRAAIRIAASLMIGVVCRAYSVLAATPPEPPTTCAIIGDVSLKESPLAALLQEKLARPGIRFVERDEVERVLAEKTLQAAFAPDGAAHRVRLGALLKAEQLILLRRSEPTRAGQGDPPAVEIVVCESSRGLRLAAQAVAIEKDLAPTIAAAEPVVSAAIRKGRIPIRDVVAVPPFISNDLSYRYDSLKSAYARVLEQMLLEETGVLVVELEEARAIARESILAGERPGLRRPLPLYLMGEFRNQGTDEQRTVSIRIGIRRGDEVIGEVAKEGISPRAVTVLLRAAAVKAVGTPTPADPAKAATPEVEARQLTDRARLFQGLGNWSEALGLMEASLLLKPDQIALHHDAVVACGRLTRRVMWDNSETNTLEQVRWAAEQYLRGLEHLEAFLRDVPDLRYYETRGQNSFVVEFHHSNAGWGIPRSASKGTVEEVAVAKSMARDSWLRIARMRLRDGRGDESKYVMYATADMPDRERYPLMLDLIREWQDRPGNAQRVREMASHGYTAEVLKSAEGQAFLAALMKMENQEIRSTAASLVREVEAYESHTRDAAAAWKTEEARRKAEDAAARAGGPPEVISEALRLNTFQPPRPLCRGWGQDRRLLVEPRDLSDEGKGNSQDGLAGVRVERAAGIPRVRRKVRLGSRPASSQTAPIAGDRSHV